MNEELDEHEETEEQLRRGRGRPRTADQPAFPRDEVDRLLVFGEQVVSEDGKAIDTVYPTYQEIADRYGVAKSLIGSYARQANVQKRRERARLRLEARIEEKMIEAQAEAIALSKEDVLLLLDGFLAQFKQALEEGRVRHDSITDLNTVVRLKEFLMGGADSRKETHHHFSLELIQQRHREFQQGIVDVTPEMAGVQHEVLSPQTRKALEAGLERAEAPAANGAADDPSSLP